MQNEELRIPTVRSIQMLLEPIYERLSNIEASLKNSKEKSKPQRYYRNADLKNNFGISPNTIIKYRETGVLPYTRLGDVYLYEVAIIERILENNKINA
ncbi:MAG: hypothetical protein RL308_2720 [Bacteroidota bacterium]|jgi:hypothetical protein